MKDILLDQVRHGATIFLTSHVLEVVERLCDHAAIINEGKIVAEGRMDGPARRVAKRWRMSSSAPSAAAANTKDSNGLHEIGHMRFGFSLLFMVNRPVGPDSPIAKPASENQCRRERGTAPPDPRTTMQFPVKPGPMSLLYPKWIPGEHGQPVRSKIWPASGSRGTAKPIPWHRDDVNIYRVPRRRTRGRVSIDVEARRSFRRRKPADFPPAARPLRSSRS